MGTRGLFGFYYKGKYYVIYNQFDSYPSGLGVNIIKQIQEAITAGKFGEWKNMLTCLKIVDENISPTSNDIKRLEKYTCTSVSNQSTLDWYCLLRKCQGSLQDVFNSGYILNCVNNSGLPIFHEYAYIINFDTNLLDFYVGDEKVNSYSFDNLPNFENSDI